MIGMILADGQLPTRRRAEDDDAGRAAGLDTDATKRRADIRLQQAR